MLTYCLLRIYKILDHPLTVVHVLSANILSIQVLAFAPMGCPSASVAMNLDSWGLRTCRTTASSHSLAVVTLSSGDKTTNKRSSSAAGLLPDAEEESPQIGRHYIIVKASSHYS